jgi:hypothetical protein
VQGEVATRHRGLGEVDRSAPSYSLAGPGNIASVLSRAIETTVRDNWRWPDWRKTVGPVMTACPARGPLDRLARQTCAALAVNTDVSQQVGLHRLYGAQVEAG